MRLLHRAYYFQGIYTVVENLKYVREGNVIKSLFSDPYFIGDTTCCGQCVAGEWRSRCSCQNPKNKRYSVGSVMLSYYTLHIVKLSYFTLCVTAQWSIITLQEECCRVCSPPIAGLSLLSRLHSTTLDKLFARILVLLVRSRVAYIKSNK